MDILIWIFIAAVFFILELITTTFFLVWFGVGSIVAAILNYLGFDIYVQFAGFIIVSIILILSTRKFAATITPEPTKKTTAERLIGMHGKVIKKLPNNSFIVNVAGEEWTSCSDDSVDVGDTVKVVGIDSIKLIIEKTD